MTSTGIVKASRSEQLEFVSGQLAAAVAERAGMNDESWLARLLRAAVAGEPIRISRSPLGYLVSTESDRPTEIQVAAQPGPSCSAATFRAILADQGPDGQRLADDLANLGDGNGYTRGPWELALGGGARGIIGYVGHADHTPLIGRIGQLTRLGWAPTQLDARAQDWLDAIRGWVVPVGLGRRYPARSAFKFYCNSLVPFKPEILEAVLKVEDHIVRERVRDFVASVPCPVGAPATHSWALGMHGDGTMKDWKLELLYPGLSAAGLYKDWPELRGFFDWASDTAEACGAVARTHILSVRVKKGATSVVPYVRFEPSGYRDIYGGVVVAPGRGGHPGSDE